MATPGTAYPLNTQWVTAWIKLSALQGFQRAYRVQILGKFEGQFALVPTTEFITGAGSWVGLSQIYVAELSPGWAEPGSVFLCDGIEYEILEVGAFDGSAASQYFVLDRAVETDMDVGTAYGRVGSLTVEIGHDYDEAFDPAWTGGLFTNGTKALRAEHHIVNQKCESVRFRFTYVSSVGPARFAGLTLQLGGKSGIFKVNSTKRF